MPKTPNVSPPTYIAVRVAIGCISKALPKIFAFKKTSQQTNS